MKKALLGLVILLALGTASADIIFDHSGDVRFIDSNLDLGSNDIWSASTVETDSVNSSSGNDIEFNNNISLSENSNIILDRQYLSDYAGANGVVESGELQDAFDDWQNDIIDGYMLQRVFEAWKSGEEVDEGITITPVGMDNEGRAIVRGLDSPSTITVEENIDMQGNDINNVGNLDGAAGSELTVIGSEGTGDVLGYQYDAADADFDINIGSSVIEYYEDGAANDNTGIRIAVIEKDLSNYDQIETEWEVRNVGADEINNAYIGVGLKNDGFTAESGDFEGSEYPVGGWVVNTNNRSFIELNNADISSGNSLTESSTHDISGIEGIHHVFLYYSGTADEVEVDWTEVRIS